MSRPAEAFAPATSKRKPVEIRRIQEIATGDQHFERELIELFLRDNEARVRRMERAVSDRDGPRLQREAHSLKGSSGNAGAGGLQEMAHQLESLATRGELDEAAEALVRLKAEFGRVRRYFRDYLRTLPA